MKKRFIFFTLSLIAVLSVIFFLATRKTDYRKELVLAVQQGNLHELNTLIKHGADIHCTTEYGAMPLHYAAALGHYEIAKALIAQGAHINTADEDGETPLLLAARNGHLAIVKLLIEHKADLNAADRYGATPLIDATLKGHAEVVHCLIESGAQITSQAAGINGQSALHIAAQSGDIPLVRILLNALPLHSHAIERNQLLALRDSTGQTAYDIALAHGYSEIAEMLSLDVAATNNNETK